MAQKTLACGQLCRQWTTKWPTALLVKLRAQPPRLEPSTRQDGKASLLCTHQNICWLTYDALHSCSKACKQVFSQRADSENWRTWTSSDCLESSGRGSCRM